MKMLARYITFDQIDARTVVAMDNKLAFDEITNKKL
jgi:hypothetical protein